MKITSLTAHKSGARLTPRTSGVEVPGAPTSDTDVGNFDDAQALQSRGEPADVEKAEDLFQTLSNEGDLYERVTRRWFIPNLAQKVVRGVYDPEKAKILWGYWVNRALQYLSQDRRGGHFGEPWHSLANTAERRVIAGLASDYYQEEVNDLAAEMKAGKAQVGHKSGARLTPRLSASSFKVGDLVQPRVALKHRESVWDPRFLAKIKAGPLPIVGFDTLDGHQVLVLGTGPDTSLDYEIVYPDEVVAPRVSTPTPIGAAGDKGSLRKDTSKIEDPTKTEMLALLKEEFPDADDFSIEEAIYWFASAYHGGQTSNLYSVLSTSPYKPGPTVKGPEYGTEAEALLEALQGRFGMNWPHDGQ